jgi:hypothetical protein
MGRQKVLDRMVSSITKIKSPLNIPLTQTLTCYCCPQIFQLCHIFKASIRYLHVMILSWILVKGHKQTLSLLCITSRLSSLLVSKFLSPLWYLCYLTVELHHHHKPVADVSFNFSPTRFSWASLMAYYKVKFKSSDNKASPSFRTYWIGNLSMKCLPMWPLL